MSRNPFRKSVGFYEVRPMTTSYTSSTNSEKAYGKPKAMEDSRETVQPETEGSGHESPRNVGFYDVKDQHKENRKKFLTAKYGQHQMFLIKKRLRVEMWIFDELRRLYNSENDDHPCELELEEILNYDTDAERREYAEEMLENAKQPKEEINKFVDELMRQARTL